MPSEIREQGKAKCSKSMVVKEFKAHQYLPGFVMPLPKRNPTKITNPILVGGMLVVEPTDLKRNSQIELFPQVGVKIKNL